MIAWSNAKLKLTAGIGALCTAGLLLTMTGKALPVWVVIGVSILPLCVFLFVQPGEMREGLVKGLQIFASVWYLLLATFLSAWALVNGKPEASWIVIFIGLGIGAIPCVVVLKGRQDPTKDWPAWIGALPCYDLATMSFGALRFGAHIEEAREFGRPDRIEWRRPDYCELIYAHGGFQLDYESERLAYLAFFIGPDAFLPKDVPVTFSRPVLGDGTVLSGDTDKDRILGIFGQAESEDVDDQETILYFRRNGVTMEFECNLSGRLKRWNLYPDPPPPC